MLRRFSTKVNWIRHMNELNIWHWDDIIACMWWCMQQTCGTVPEGTGTHPWCGHRSQRWWTWEVDQTERTPETQRQDPFLHINADDDYWHAWIIRIIVTINNSKFWNIPWPKVTSHNVFFFFFIQNPDALHLLSLTTKGALQMTFCSNNDQHTKLLKNVIDKF